MMIMTLLLGLLFGAVVAYAAILAARFQFREQLKKILEQQLLKSMQSQPMPQTLQLTTKQCMQEAIAGLKQKMPLVSVFITPKLISTMEEAMLEKLQAHWPLLLESLVPSLGHQCIDQALDHCLLTCLFVGYSALLGGGVGFLIGLAF